MTARPARASIIPALRYRDAAAAIAWLDAAFGFTRHLVVPGEDGSIAHAQLALDGAMIMLGSVRDDDYGRRVRPPGEVGGVNTQAPYVVVGDADALHERAVAAGAQIVMPLEDADHGGRVFSCLDPEGHLWSFGTYDPWSEADGAAGRAP